MGNIIVLNSSNFAEVTSTNDKLVAVDFWAQWCIPCRAVAPALDKLANEYPDNLIVGKLNIDENQELSQSIGITSIPTILLYAGGKILEALVGAHPYQHYKDIVERHIAGGA